MKTEPNQSLQTISCGVTVAAEPLCVPPHEMSDLKRSAKRNRMLTSPKKETDDIPGWAITLLKVSFLFPLITGFFGAVAYSGKSTSIMAFPPFMLGAIAGATWGCCVGSIALIASFMGGGLRSLISIPAFLIHFGGTILAIIIYVPKK